MRVEPQSKPPAAAPHPSALKAAKLPASWARGAGWDLTAAELAPGPKLRKDDLLSSHYQRGTTYSHFTGRKLKLKGKETALTVLGTRAGAQ